MSAASEVAAAAKIPAEAIARLERNLESFVQGVREGLENGSAEPAQPGRWQRALGLLERDLEAVKAAARRAATGDNEAIVSHASRLRFLARRMDGYKLDFAGAALAERLEMQRRLTVLVAWQIFAVASGSKASGL